MRKLSLKWDIEWVFADVVWSGSPCILPRDKNLMQRTNNSGEHRSTEKILLIDRKKLTY